MIRTSAELLCAWSSKCVRMEPRNAAARVSCCRVAPIPQVKHWSTSQRKRASRYTHVPRHAPANHRPAHPPISAQYLSWGREAASTGVISIPNSSQKGHPEPCKGITDIIRRQFSESVTLPASQYSIVFLYSGISHWFLCSMWTHRLHLKFACW